MPISPLGTHPANARVAIGIGLVARRRIDYEGNGREEML